MSSASRAGCTSTPTRAAGRTTADFELEGSHRNDVEDASREQVGEVGVEQRAVVVIGAHRDDGGEEPAGLGDGRHEPVEEPALRRLVDGHEELLELVEHEHARGHVRQWARWPTEPRAACSPASGSGQSSAS